MAKVKLLDPSDPRRKLDRYELIGEIATGGMATVFLARLGGVGGFQRFVAIKRLHPHLANEQEFVEMFLDEARLAALIHHPHVVPILEVGVSDSGYYIVMEYVEGDTLSKIVARSMSGGRMVPRHILIRILLDMLSGLHAAHELADDRGQLLGLVHRDVSPQNVLVGVDGSSRITDFGVARATARLTSTGSGKLKGKLAYMAPEQTRGDELDRRTDLFAAGIICWEVLAGKRLFKADTEAATLNRILVEPVRPVSEVNAEIPRVFDAVLARALDRDPRRRFQTAQEMFDVLEHTAIESAKSGSVEVGIASPREVASYVQTILGQEIGAQRESVRAWLAQSDSSAPRVSPSGTPRPRDGAPHRRSRRDGEEDSRSGDYSSSTYDGPPPIAPMADVTMRFALQTPGRTPPPAKKSSPTLIGQGPMVWTDKDGNVLDAPPGPTRAVPPPAAGSPAPQPSPQRTEEPSGLATSLLGEEGDDAPTVLKQSSRPPSANEEEPPRQYNHPPAAAWAQQQAQAHQQAQHQHAQHQQAQQQAQQQPQNETPHVTATVKTARGLFAADLLERARIEAEKAQAARAANGVHHANGASSEAPAERFTDAAQADAAHRGGAYSSDPSRNEPTSIVTRTASTPPHLQNEAGRSDTAGTSLTNGSMTLPSQFQVYAQGPTSSPEPPKRSALRYIVLTVVGLSLAAVLVIFLQMRGTSHDDATTGTPTASAADSGHAAPRPTAAPTATDTSPSQAQTSQPATSASAKSTDKGAPVKGRPGGRGRPTPPTHTDPPPTHTDPPPTHTDPPPTPTPGDNLSNPYHPKP